MFGDNKLGTKRDGWVWTTVKILARNIDCVRPVFWDICPRQLTITGIVFSSDRILRLKTIYFTAGESGLT